MDHHISAVSRLARIAPVLIAVVVLSFSPPSSALSGVWTAGPTRLTFIGSQAIGDAQPLLYAYEQYGTVGTWVSTTAASSPGATFSEVVIQALSGNWETHLFYARELNGGLTVGHVKRLNGDWGADSMTPMPPGVSVQQGPAAVSNVYNSVSGLVIQGSTPQIAVYFIGSDGNLWETSYNNGAWASSWTNLLSFNPQFPGVDPMDQGEMHVTGEFDNGVFTTQVWIIDDNGSLNRNEGPFNGDAQSRVWAFGWEFAVDLYSDGPAVVTWYDSQHIGDPNFVHTRAVVRFPDELVAAYIEPGGVTGPDPLGFSAGYSLTAGPALADCGGCATPPTIYRVVAISDDNPPQVAYMDKDSGNLHSWTPDTWTRLPPPPQVVSSVTRIPYGGGLGPIYALGSDLFEYSSAGNAWLNHAHPGQRPVAAGIGGNNLLQAVVLDSNGSPYTAGSYDPATGTWSVGSGAFSNQTQYKALATARGVGNRFFVFGVQTAAERAAIAGVQETNGTWSGPMALPNQNVRFSSLLAARGNTGLVQLVGLGKTDGRAYLAARQNADGTWTAGAQLPGQTMHMSALAMGPSSARALQVIGLGSDRKAYLVARQDSSGNWQSGMALPGSPSNLTAITVANGNSNFLQVLGLTTTGSLVLISWQDGTGAWHAGFPLSAPTALSQIAASPDVLGHLQVIGLSATNGLPYQAAWQDASGNWNAGAAIPNVDWMPLADLTLARAGDNTLHVLGSGTDDYPYEMARQDQSGNWQPGSGFLWTPKTMVTGVVATQSSTAFGGTPDRASDGNADGNFFDGSVTHTDYENQPWWQAALPSTVNVAFVDIYNRTDCCGDRLTNFNVSISMDGTKWTTVNVPAQAGSPTRVVFPYGYFASYVRVQLVGTNYLSLAEVKIWAQ
jgi:hypothetical protein